MTTERDFSAPNPAQVSPTGLRPPGLAWRLPWESAGMMTSTLKGLWPMGHADASHNPVGVEEPVSISQGRRCAPTLGWRTQPRWGRSAEYTGLGQATHWSV